jgi:hypothetical protein
LLESNSWLGVIVCPGLAGPWNHANVKS